MNMKSTGKSRLKPLLASIAMVVVGLVMIFAAWKLTHGPLPPPPPPPVEYGPKRKAFFEKEIAPLIAAEDDGNRVAIARAVISRPQLLLADEPTGNVDDQIALRLIHMFEELNKLGMTVVVATHNENLVSRFPHPQLRLQAGRLRAE